MCHASSGVCVDCRCKSIDYLLSSVERVSIVYRNTFVQTSRVDSRLPNECRVCTDNYRTVKSFEQVPCHVVFLPSHRHHSVVILEDRVSYTNLKEFLRQPLADNRVNHGEDGSYPKTVVAVYSQDAFTDTVQVLVTDVLQKVAAAEETNAACIIGFVSANGCHTGQHRAHVCNLSAKGVLNEITLEGGAKPFQAQVFSLHDKKGHEFQRVLNDAWCWITKPWGLRAQSTQRYAEAAVETSASASQSYDALWSWVAEVNNGSVLAPLMSDIRDKLELATRQTALTPRQPSVAPTRTPRPPSVAPSAARASREEVVTRAAPLTPVRRNDGRGGVGGDMRDGGDDRLGSRGGGDMRGGGGDRIGSRGGGDMRGGSDDRFDSRGGGDMRGGGDDTGYYSGGGDKRGGGDMRGDDRVESREGGDMRGGGEDRVDFRGRGDTRGGGDRGGAWGRRDDSRSMGRGGERGGGKWGSRARSRSRGDRRGGGGANSSQWGNGDGGANSSQWRQGGGGGKARSGKSYTESLRVHCVFTKGLCSVVVWFAGVFTGLRHEFEHIR